MNYKLAFALGLIPPGGGGREPVAYSYNGVRLPKLPEWDKTVYPYAVITESVSDFIGVVTYGYSLYVFERTPTVYHWNGTDIAIHGDDDGIKCNIYKRNTSKTAWEFYLSVTSYPSDAIAPPIWSNFDLHHDDGYVYLNKSDPIPVYE